MEEERSWYPNHEGIGKNKRGPVGGKILQDEIYGDPDDQEDADARVTLEEQGSDTFAVTANLYGGWFQKTAEFPDKVNAETAYASARQELAALAALIPDESDRDINAAVQRLNERIAAFESNFGGQPTL